MTDQSSSQGRPDDWSRGGYVPGEQYSDGQFPDEQYYDDQYYGASGFSRPGTGGSGSGGSDYGVPGSGSVGYGGSGQGGIGAARVSPGTLGQGPAGPGGAGPGAAGPGAAGPGMPTAPIWQAAPGPGGAGQSAPGQGVSGQAGAGYGGPPPTGSYPMGEPLAATSADAKGFLGALFDFSFTSFVTTRIIKVLYVLILVLVLLSALVFTIGEFRASATRGFLTLIVGDPLFIIIVMAFWRLVLESFVVRFRIAEDVRAMRERNDR